MKLQGCHLNLIKTQSIISAFVSNLFMYKQNLGRGEFSQFPNLLKLQSREVEFLAYCQQLMAFYADVNQKIWKHFSLGYSRLVVEPFCVWTTSDSKHKWIQTNTGAAYGFIHKRGT